MNKKYFNLFISIFFIMSSSNYLHHLVQPLSRVWWTPVTRRVRVLERVNILSLTLMPLLIINILIFLSFLYWELYKGSFNIFRFTKQNIFIFISSRRRKHLFNHYLYQINVIDLLLLSKPYVRTVDQRTVFGLWAVH